MRLGENVFDSLKNSNNFSEEKNFRFITKIVQ